VSLRLFIHTQASEDIDQYAGRIGEDSPRAAARFQESALDTAQWLTEFPGAGHVVRMRRNEGLRVCAVRGFPNHLIFYREHAGLLEVVRIVHGARDLPRVLAPTIKWLRERPD
jgi:toxin ParE1/3/4